MYVAHKLGTPLKSHLDYLTNSTPESMYIEPVSPSTVIATAIKLKPKTSSGIDEISTKLQKDTVEKVIEPLAYIINKSLDTGIIPDDLKIAKVIPIYKSSDPSLLKKLPSHKFTASIFKIIGENYV